jgi:hypothetical protein
MKLNFELEKEELHRGQVLLLLYPSRGRHILLVISLRVSAIDT